MKTQKRNVARKIFLFEFLKKFLKTRLTITKYRQNRYSMDPDWFDGQAKDQLTRHIVENLSSEHKFPLERLKGKCLAIDASCWLRKSLSTVSIDDLISTDFVDYMLYVDFLLVRVRNFRMSGIEPVMVFDGRRHKTASEKLKETNAEYYYLQGKRLLHSSIQTTDVNCKMKLKREAQVSFQRAQVVTHEIEKNSIAALKKLGITVVVAPYDSMGQV